jgi:protein SCO1/2
MICSDTSGGGRHVASKKMGGRFAAILALLCLIAAGLPASAAPPDTSGISYDQRLGASLPLASRFTDQTGRSMALRDVIHGTPTVLALGYFACPALCGLIRDDMFAALSQTGLRAGSDYQIVFLSIDPSETPAQALNAWRADLAAYPSFGAGGGMHFLVGHKQDVDAVEAAVGYHSRYDLSLKQFIHPAGIVVVSPTGIISSYLLGVGYQAGDVRAAVVRARQGGIAKAALPVLLLCFHFDSTTGRYTLVIAKLLRLAGALTIVMILALLFILRRSGRDQRVR